MDELESSVAIDVLLVEDSADDTFFILQALRMDGYEPSGRQVQTASGLRLALTEKKWDLIISDYRLPNFSGLEAFEIYRQFDLDIPFIIVSGAISEEIAVTAMKAGVHDYLKKDNLARLGPAAKREIAEAGNRKERRQSEVALEKANVQLKKALAEKDVLLREVQHRVKNNLQVISSILSLEERRFPEGELRKVLRNNRDRIRSMALIHDKFCYSEHLANIDFGEYIQSLADYFMSAHSPSQKAIELFIEVDLDLDMDHALPLGLITQELLSNSMKYAFPNGTGQIRIESRQSQDELTFIYHDSGPGLPGSVDLFHSKSLGLQLVCDLVQQLDGEIAYKGSAGSTFTMRFKFELKDEPLASQAALA